MSCFPPGVIRFRFLRVAGFTAGLAMLFYGNSARAYCRTTTCDALQEDCQTSSEGCSLSGLPLSWSSPCLYYGTQEDGSTRRDIQAQQVAQLLEAAFTTWVEAECPGGNPPFVSQSIGLVECSRTEFNCGIGDPNANTVMFRDDSWPYDDAALAITTVTVDVRDGEILDADMEINSHNFDFTIGDIDVNNDLLSVLTHEVGHYLGLSHSSVSGSTMFAGYNSRDTSIRTLHDDDVAGICEIFPANSRALSCNLDIPETTACIGGSECEARQLASEDGCTLAPAGPRGSPRTGLVAVSLVLGLWLCRRRV